MLGTSQKNIKKQTNAQPRKKTSRRRFGRFWRENKISAAGKTKATRDLGEQSYVHSRKVLLPP
jgi:hypothetical protein